MANHPPLFYAVSALPLELGERFGTPRAGLLAARLLSATLAAGGLVMVAWLALVLVPDRPRVAVGAAWLAALLPSLPHVSAFVYNDGLGFLAASAALVSAAIVVRRGPTLARLAGLATAAAAAALTRAPGLALVVVAGVAAMAGVLLHGRRPPAGRLLLAAGRGALVAGVAGGLAIGFYLRNRSLYGSFTGAAYNQRLFGFQPQDHVLALLRSPAYGLRLYDGLWVWTRFNLPQVPAVPALVAAPRAIGLLAVAGLAVAAAEPPARPPAGRPGPPRGGRMGASSWPGRPRCSRWSPPTTATVATPIPATCSPPWPCSRSGRALGLDRLPGARHGLWVAGVALAQLVLTGAAWGGFLTALDGRRPDGPVALLGGIAGLLVADGVRWPAVVLGLAGVLLVSAFGLLAAAVTLLARPRPEAPPQRGRAPALELSDAP